MVIFYFGGPPLKPRGSFLGLKPRHVGTDLCALAGRNGGEAKSRNSGFPSMQPPRHIGAFAVLVLLAPAVLAEEVDVRQRGRLSLDEFNCAWMESSFIRRACYDHANRYLLIQLGSTWRQYCGVPEETASALIEAESAARFFNAHIRGKFVCGEGSGRRD
jgi:hypothetical protein